MSEPENQPLPVFKPGEKVCGNCKLWRPHSVDHRGWVGECRVQPNRGLFVPSAPICNAFAPRGVASAPVDVSAPAERKVRNIAPVVRRPGSVVTFKATRADTTPIDLGDLADMTKQELMEVFLEATGQAEVPLAPKWEGGSVQMVPGNKELQPKELPIDALFHKVVMVRDRLRTLEQKINAHPKLSDVEKVEMQQYVTRCYGSLTTFNVLFRDKNDQFVGSKGDE